ncbi:MAG: Gfo/Idh/MocA family oxidoreductase [bacterium]|nr:Gfo/Idh/MocA family oxidoreductase [bacterium]
MSKMNIAIIGATGTAYKRTIPALKNSKVCSVSAIQGRNVEKLKKIQSEFDIPNIHLDVDEMLSSASYDLIFIATPPFMHYTNIQSSVKTKKPIICEKPIARNYEEGLKISNLLNGYGDESFAVAHHLRHQYAIVDVKNYVSRGLIGKILGVYIQWGFEMNLTAANARWKMDPGLGGKGTFNDNGIHIVDLALYLFGRPNFVYGVGRNIRLTQTFDDESAILVYENTLVELHSSQSTKFPGNHLLIYGSDGHIQGFNAIGERSISNLHIKSDSEDLIRSYPETNLYGNEVEDFSIRLSGGKPISNGTNLREALDALLIIDKTRESTLSNMPLRLS